MEFFLLWWFLAGLVGVLARARRRRPLPWLVLGIVLTPIPALLLLFNVPEGAMPVHRPWGRVQVVALAPAPPLTMFTEPAAPAAVRSAVPWKTKTAFGSPSKSSVRPVVFLKSTQRIGLSARVALL